MDIRFESFGVDYPNGVRALDDVTLTVPAGQFCAVLGASGAGKSTLLGAINGLARPSRGQITTGGTVVEPRSLARLRMRIGLIPQDFALCGRASVADNVLAGAAAAMPLWRALSGRYPEPWRRRGAELLAAIGLEEAHLARRADSLSGGQQQRVAIARALIRRPSILLADEPVASLDHAASEAILALIRAQAQSLGATVICTLHQPDLAQRFADRIIVLEKGHVVSDRMTASLDFEGIYAETFG